MSSDQPVHTAAPTLEPTATLEEVDIRAELRSRPHRPPDHERENRALGMLAREMAENPRNMLQKLVEIAVDLCGADSAGVSLLEGDVFRREALAGVVAASRNSTMPRDASPCGVCIDRNATQLMHLADRRFPALRADPRFVEALLVPFHDRGEPVGTVWVVAHTFERKFDREDARVVGVLAEFASAGWQLWKARAAAERASRRTEEDLQAAVAALCETDRKLAATLNNMTDGVVTFDREWRYTYVNPAAARIIGSTPAAMLGRDVREMFLEPDQMPVYRQLGRCLEEKVPVQFEHHSPRTGRWHEHRCHPTSDGLVVYFSDITDRKAAAEDLQQSARQFRQLADAIPQIAWTARPDGTVDYCNEQVRQVEGFHQRPDGSWEWIPLIHPDDARKTTEAWRRALTTGALYQMEHRLRLPNGQWRWHLSRAVALRDEHGRVTKWFGTATDIEDAKRAEEALRRSEQRLRLAMDFAGVGMWDAELADETAFWSPQHFTLLGYEPAPDGHASVEMWRMCVHADDRDRVMEEYRQAMEQRRDFRIDYRVIRADDRRTLWVSALGQFVYDQGGKAVRFAGLFFDITERKEAEALATAKLDAERAMAVAQEANAAKDHFLAVLSHELRTPLTPALVGVSRLLQATGVDDRTRDVLDMIRRNVRAEAALIDDLLDVTRIARGKIDLSKRIIDVCQVIRQAAEMVEREIEGLGLEFGVDFGPDAPYAVDADPDRLQQVFSNLLTNAIKFTPASGRIGIRCGRNEGDGSVVIEVHDTGEGIAPDALSRIFRPFEQAERDTARRFGGLGLGLAISKALVEMHGGTIDARSDGKGTGATFRVALPLCPRAVPPRAAPQPPAPVGAPSAFHPLRILLVEDDADTASIVREALRGAGYEVRTAGEAGSALSTARQWDFDLLISDLGLPGRSGLELMRDFRGAKPRLLGIALSGYGTEQDIARSRDSGFTEHLVKPVDIDDLEEAIRRVAGTIRAARSAE